MSGSALDSPPFDLLTPAERARLRDSAEEVDYAPGATLSAPPAEPAGVWLLLGGRVRLERQGAAAFRARSGGQGGDRPEPMSDYGPGELVALRSALTGHADGAWIALEAVRALRIPAAGLRELGPHDLGERLVVGYGLDFRYTLEPFLDPFYNDLNALVDAILERLLALVHAWTTQQRDDLTLVVLRYRGLDA